MWTGARLGTTDNCGFITLKDIMETLVINSKASKVSGKLVSNVVNLENLIGIRDG